MMDLEIMIPPRHLNGVKPVGVVKNVSYFFVVFYQLQAWEVKEAQ